jgi:hypothetical protein
MLEIPKSLVKFIKEEGEYDPEFGSQPGKGLTHHPLRYLIENNHVFQDENKDWVMITYSHGVTNGECFNHWLKTGYKTNWIIDRWKPDTNLDIKHSCYSHMEKEGWDTEFFSVIFKNHEYCRITRNSVDKECLSFFRHKWTETVKRLDIDGSYGEEQLYYRDSSNFTQRKMPVKIGKKVQELRDKGIENGVYEF